MSKPRYKKNPNVPSAVSDFASKNGRVGGLLSAHKRHGTPLPADIVEQQKAKAKKVAAIEKARAKLEELIQQPV